MYDAPTSWSVVAQNSTEHAENPIHTDDGAQAAGFPSALVAGVTTYAYLTHPLVAAWGLDWLTHGGGEVRFRAPVFAGAEIECVPIADGEPNQVTVDAICSSEERNPRVTFRATTDSGPPPLMRAGDRLRSRQYVLAGRYGPDYGARVGDDLDLYEHEQVVPSAVWPAIANNIFSTDLVNGAWIHTRSLIRHHAAGPAGATVDVQATVVDRFDRRGHRAVVDVLIEHDGRPLATLEHEAIVDLTGT